MEVSRDADGRPYFMLEEERQFLDDAVPLSSSPLAPEKVSALSGEGFSQLQQLLFDSQYVFTESPEATGATGATGEIERLYYELQLKRHFGIWSLLPAFVAILLCWITKEPIAALFTASLIGAVMLGRFNYSEEVLLPSFMSSSTAGVLILYLWFLGGLLGIWSRSGAARAFAEWISLHFVRGPRSARLVAWALGILFFQGGTISTVLVGTTVKPLSDRQRVSHEEISYVVDSTASPIACLLAFNAWPGYIQALLFVPGVHFLATEESRLSFFFQSVPFSFYSIFAVIGTFLFSIDKLPLIGERMRKAIQRSRTTGQLDAPQARPLSAQEIQNVKVPDGYRPVAWEFVLPLMFLLSVAVGTFIFSGSPQVRWAFGGALLLAIVISLARGMRLSDMIEGLGEGFKGVVMGSLILLLAIILGGIAAETGSGIYLAELLGKQIPYYLLPAGLLVITIVVAFSTGTSWGTYAVIYPLAMPLAWAVAQDISEPVWFMSICFAAVLNGSVIGDQTSPISDTTILSSMCTGCDLMDHVLTQIVPVMWATLLSLLCWTVAAFLCI